MRKELDQPRPQTKSHTVESRMAIMKHPIHPVLVSFPVAFLTMLAPLDVLYLWLQDPFWAQLAFWLNAGGLAFGVLAGLVGTVDLLSIRVVRRHVSAWSHFVVAVMALSLAALGVWLRYPDPAAAVWPWGLLQSSVTLVVVAVAGWLGGTLTFRHGIGVYGEDGAELEEGDDKDPPAG